MSEIEQRNKYPNNEFLKVPLQSITKTGKPIFAYLRRSTSKLEQADSLIQQEDGIDAIVKRLGLSRDDIIYFAETRSGFENKKRKQWQEMTSMIEALKSPCMILARDLSRLSRNPTDSQWILDRLYGDNGQKRVIEKIVTLDLDDLKTWSMETDKMTMHSALTNCYYDSLDTKNKSIGGIILKLESGSFPYPAPKGLEHYILNGKRILKQNEAFKYVEKAFDMKGDGKTLKEISNYLEQNGAIKVKYNDLTKRLFTNTVYIGQYTEKTTGCVFKNLQFFEGVPPISGTKWDKVQENLGKKRGNYGSKQEGDILSQKLRTSEGRRMSKYLAKGKYKNYTNAIEKIHISEKAIVTQFLSQVVEIILNLALKKDLGIKPIGYSMVDGEPLLYCDRSEFHKNSLSIKLSEVEVKGASEPGLILNREIYEKAIAKDRYKNVVAISCSKLAKIILKWAKSGFEKGVVSQFRADSKDLEKERRDQLTWLALEISKLENEKKSYRRNAISFGYTREEIDETTAEIERSIQLLQESVHEISASTDVEKYLERLPSILNRIFELTDKALADIDIDEIKEVILQLINISTFELTINKEKELQVKLFEVLDGLLSSGNVDMEAPPGIEPG